MRRLYLLLPLCLLFLGCSEPDPRQPKDHAAPPYSGGRREVMLFQDIRVGMPRRTVDTLLKKYAAAGLLEARDGSYFFDFDSLDGRILEAELGFEYQEGICYGTRLSIGWKGLKMPINPLGSSELLPHLLSRMERQHGPPVPEISEDTGEHQFVWRKRRQAYLLTCVNGRVVLFHMAEGG